jgi:hypothetical protein
VTERSPEAEQTDGQALLASLQKKTKFAPVEDRPGWGFDLSGTMLETVAQPTDGDPWTAEQRAKGLALDFVYLNLTEHQQAEGRAGRRFAAFGGDQFSTPIVLHEERAFIALASIDGVPAPKDIEQRERLWYWLGEKGRALVSLRYAVATGAEDTAAVSEAVERSSKSFRVRG